MNKIQRTFLFALLICMILLTGCASHKEQVKAPETLKITADDLKMLDVAHTVISEPVGGAHNNPVQMAENLQEYLIGAVKKLSQVPIEKLLANRYNKFRKVGDVSE